jgi:NAD(P)-dependent dehydrogenase (short-subunit alcohol dehydrogenase family)
MLDALNPNLLLGRTALIAGCGTGLGLGMAQRFACLGADVVICGRRQGVLEEAVADILAAAPERQVWSEVCDIRYLDSIAAMMDRVEARAGIDILVNNAAANSFAKTNVLSRRAADALLGRALHGDHHCTLEVARRWIAGGRPGVILSILSTSTISGLAVEWGPRNIRLVTIAPGPLPTAGSQAQTNPVGHSAQRRPSGPLGRVGDNAELADLACFLVSDAASFITGVMAMHDGCLHLRTSGADDLRWNMLQEIEERR